MTWFKVDDGFATSRPVLAIPRRYRAQAVGLWTLAGTWSAKELTDGHVPDYVVTEVAASTPAIAAWLVKVGLWEVCSDCNGFLFRSWSKYQPTKEQVLARRSEEAERKRRARESRRKVVDQQESSGVPAGHPADTLRTPVGLRAESVLPDPTRPDPALNTYVVTRGGGVALGDARDPNTPPPPCPRHEENSNEPCHACQAVRLWGARLAESQAEDELRARRVARERAESCPVCHGTNWIPDTDPAVHCDHGLPEAGNA